MRTGPAGASATSRALTTLAGRWRLRIAMLLGLILATAYLVGVATAPTRDSKAAPPTPVVTDPSTEGEPQTKVTPTTVAPAKKAQPKQAADLPYAIAAVNSSKKKVFAHYFPPYPISLDNKEPSNDYYSRGYLHPDGESGKFKAVGGMLRDRPLPRPPIAQDHELVDAMTEVDQAAKAGIDGFTLDLLGWSGPLWDRSLLMAKAAERSGTGFVVVPSIDLHAGADDSSVEVIAERLAELYASPAAYRLPDGRYVLSSFKAEGRSVGWWQRLLKELRNSHDIDVALIAVLLDSSEDNIYEYAPISYALSNWGLRTSNGIVTAPDHAGRARRAGVKWMAPIVVQDVRHDILHYAEAGNTELLRASWMRALNDHSDLVQLITWNDYSESTHFAPSQAHGMSFLDVNGYFLTRFKKGRVPFITGDELVVTHRIQRHAARTSRQSGRMKADLSGSRVKPRDAVEVLAMLQAPAEITVRVGSATSRFPAAAGLSSITVPLREGKVSASAVRAGQPVATVTSPYAVVASPRFADLQYYAAASR